jgi:hypothetical protein
VCHQETFLGICVFSACWESQCVCQCMGSSDGINCMRACIRCADTNGAPIHTIEAEQWCQDQVCDTLLTPGDKARLSCCALNDSNLGGCRGGGLAAPLNPNPNDRRCQDQNPSVPPPKW